MKQILSVLTLLLLCTTVYAQKNSVFTTMPVTIFEDNFQSDPVGGFPEHWCIMRPDSVKYKRYCKVHVVEGRKALVIPTLAQWSKVALLSAPSPRMGTADYLPATFTLEFDFLMGKTPSMALSFFATHADDVLDIWVSNNRSVSYLADNGREDSNSFSTTIPRLDPKQWHHLALAYKEKQATCYINGKKAFTTPALIRNPHKFTLEYNSWDTAYGSQASDTIAYTNFRITTDNYQEAANFNHLLSEKKFTTHAIHFDHDQATIKDESITFMHQLADWLKAHPTVKLQIDGHTDNDGIPEHNLQLSQQRADAVKAMLVSIGINKTRLTAKGYGASKPLKPNTTTEGKAENRRVEFIRK